jgi:hypothetical protein
MKRILTGEIKATGTTQVSHLHWAWPFIFSYLPILETVLVIRKTCRLFLKQSQNPGCSADFVSRSSDLWEFFERLDEIQLKAVLCNFAHNSTGMEIPLRIGHRTSEFFDRFPALKKLHTGFYYGDLKDCFPKFKHLTHLSCAIQTDGRAQCPVLVF